MKTKPVDTISFGYQHPLKTLWKKGLLPTVKKGFYGDELTMKTVSLEHLQPKSQGGKTSLDNLVLASKRTNNLRGDKPLQLFIMKQKAIEYFYQFINIKIKGFDGNKYIESALNKLSELNIKLF
jgi:hypothetical protein